MIPTEQFQAPVMSMPMVVYGFGWLGFLGWVSLCLLLLFGMIVVGHRITCNKVWLAPAFFSAAHVQALFFTLTNGVCAIQLMFCCCCGGLEALMFEIGQALFVFAVGIGLTMAATLTVALVTSEKPTLPFWSVLSIGLLAVDIAMLVGGPLMLVAYTK